MARSKLFIPDRRAFRRHAVELCARCNWIDEHRIIRSAPGKVVDLSSGGIRFTVGDRIEPGTDVELLIDWPFALRNGCALTLRTCGVIVRNWRGSIIMDIEIHEFLTRGPRSFHLAPEPGPRVDALG